MTQRSIRLYAMAIDVIAPVDCAASTNHIPKSRSKLGLWTLTLGSIGVVYGDIGTSPLYAFREAVVAAVGTGTPTRAAVLGILSLILWALIIVVTIKYVLLLLRADNAGEGGTLALMALANKSLGKNVPFVTLLGVIGAALFFGDAMITPAISVLSAIEGLKLATPLFEPYVLPISVVILLGLFAIQSRGTASIARYFGPIMLIWFLAIGTAGLAQLVTRPDILEAFNPSHGMVFLAGNGTVGLLTLGAVFLAVTGAEALYADLGHFGKCPIQIAWAGLVLPTLALNYLGQGALILADPKAIENPFYRMFPEKLLLPMIVLAALATVIASQAVITGAFSLSRQAIQLGLLPRLEIRHTSEAQHGQIYMPQINGLLLTGVLFLVALFKTSSSLATAYGIAVTGTMVVTAMMAFIVVWKGWRWPMIAAALLIAPLLLIDIVFLGANLLKVADGGWVTLLVGAGFLLIMLTWSRGTRVVNEKSKQTEVPLADLIRQLDARPPQKITGTGIYLTSQREYAPSALLHTLKHFRVMHERVVIMSIHTDDEPRVPIESALKIEQLSPTFWRMDVRCGFMEQPNIPKVLAASRKLGWKFDIMQTSFMLSRRSIKVASNSSMPRWRDHLFIGMASNAFDATEYFRIPKERVVEVGTQVGI